MKEFTNRTVLGESVQTEAGSKKRSAFRGKGNIMKRTLAVLLMLCMFVSLFSGMAFAVEETAADAQVLTEAAAAEEASAAGDGARTW